MTYKINGVEIAKPTSMKWDDKKEHGITGTGNTVYGRFRSAELKWNILYPADVVLLQNAFLYSQNSGQVVVELPSYGVATYQFTEYSGCYLPDLRVGEFFEEHYSDVTLVVTRVSA